MIGAATAFWVVTALVGCGCGARASAQGEWSRIDPKTGIPMGDVLKVEGEAFTLTGNPAMSGRVESKDGNVQLVIEKIGDKTRDEAIKAGGAIDVKKRIESLDAQMVFKVEKQEGKTRLVQVGKSGDFAEWRFEKRPSP